MRALVTASNILLTAIGARKEDTTAMATMVLATNLLYPIAINPSPNSYRDPPLFRKANAGGQADVYFRDENSSSVDCTVRITGSADYKQQSGSPDHG